MSIIWLFLFALFLAGGLFAASRSFGPYGKREKFEDKDADGEPDEPGGPADKL